MENIKIEVEGKEFKPFTIKMEMKVNTPEELQEMREEFSEGMFTEDYSECSILIGKLMEKLHETISTI